MVFGVMLLIAKCRLQELQRVTHLTPPGTLCLILEGFAAWEDAAFEGRVEGLYQGIIWLFAKRGRI